MENEPQKNRAEVSKRGERYDPTGARRRVLTFAVALFAAVGALVAYLSYRSGTPEPVTPVAVPSPGATPSDAPPSPSTQGQVSPSPDASASPPASPSATPATEATPDASQWNWPDSAPAAESPSSQEDTAKNVAPPLLVPVEGIRVDQLQDTFTASRSQGRVHNAIDIIAPKGTPVLATADGRVVKLFNSIPGGVTIYQLSTDEKLVYYYAHLERYADNLKEGHLARRGEVIGYVGDTGNATPGNYHLHFSVSVVSDPRRHWEGVNVNPYPLLKR